ncbi:hypothetical protein ACRAWF_15215 [Streptomyces sp. L7]
MDQPAHRGVRQRPGGLRPPDGPGEERPRHWAWKRDAPTTGPSAAGEEEGIDRLRRSLRAYDVLEPTEEDELALFRALTWLVWLSHVVGRHAEAGLFIDQYQVTCRRAKNPDLAVLGACHEPFHAMLSGRHDDVEELFVRAENGIANTAFHWDRAVLQTNWTTYCLQRGDIDGARAHGRTAVAAARAAGDDYARAFSLVLRGDADESGGFRDRARAHWTEAVHVLRPIGARALYAYTALRIVCLDIGEGAIATAEHRLAEVARLADELGADDVRAAAAILRGALAFHGNRFPEARTIFAGVWDSPTAPLDRRAMAALGMVAVAAFGPPAPSVADRDTAVAGPRRQGARPGARTTCPPRGRRPARHSGHLLPVRSGRRTRGGPGTGLARRQPLRAGRLQRSADRTGRHR